MMAVFSDASGNRLAEYCFYEYSQSVTQISTNALDGTPYVQNIGRARKTITAKLVLTVTQRGLLESAHENGDICELRSDSETRYGIITNISVNPRILGGSMRIDVILEEVPG